MYNEIIDLNEDFPEKNSGFIIIRPKNVQEGSYCMDAYGIYRTFVDPRSAKDPENFQAEIAADANGVIVTELTLPYAILHDTGAMMDAEKKYDGVCEKTKLEMEKLAAAVTRDPRRQKKTTLIRFPKGVKICNDYLNGVQVKMSGKGNKLKPNGRFLPYTMDVPDLEKFNFVMPFVFWKAPIIGTITLTNQKAASHSDNVFVDALKGVFPF
jgi:hypothetical protein